jgi:hypothetical protein
MVGLASDACLFVFKFMLQSLIFLSSELRRSPSAAAHSMFLLIFEAKVKKAKAKVNMGEGLRIEKVES